MKKTVRFRGMDVTMKCSEMSHSAVGGEYEIGLSPKMELDLGAIWQGLKNSGYELEERTDRSLSLLHNKSVITVLKKGRILIQDLLPDTFEKALILGEEVIHAAQEI
jgi:hypothetical protein